MSPGGICKAYACIATKHSLSKGRAIGGAQPRPDPKLFELKQLTVGAAVWDTMIGHAHLRAGPT